MATKTDRDYDFLQQQLDLRERRQDTADETAKYKQQAMMQQAELNKLKAAALLNDQGTWHEGGPMQFAQAGNDITGLAYSAPYREGGNYIELNKPFQAANPYQTPEAFNYTPRELTPPEEIEVSAQDQAELDSKAAEFYDIQRQLSNIKYSGNPKEKELRNRAAQIEYEYKKLSSKARDNYKIAKEGLGKGYLSSFDVNSGDRRYYADYDPAMVLKQYSDAIIQLNHSLNRAVVGSADYNRIIRDRERMRNDLIRRRDTAPTKELAFSYQAEIDKLGRPTRDLAAEAEIEDKKRAWGRDKDEVLGVAIYLDELQRGVPAAIATFNGQNKDFQLVRDGNEIVIKQAMETVKTEGHDSTPETMSKGTTTTKGWKEKGRFKIGDPNAFHSIATLAVNDEKLRHRTMARFYAGDFDEAISQNSNRSVAYINPQLQEQIRQNQKAFADGLIKGSLKNMFTLNGSNIKKVGYNKKGEIEYILDNNEVVTIDPNDKSMKTANRFGLSNEVNEILYSENDKAISTIPNIYLTGKSGDRKKIDIYRKEKFVGSQGKKNLIVSPFMNDIEN